MRAGEAGARPVIVELDAAGGGRFADCRLVGGEDGISGLRRWLDLGGGCGEED
jgi:hypothetical protein